MMTIMRTTMLTGAVAWGLTACASDSADELPPLTPAEDWTTEPQYQFGDQLRLVRPWLSP